jgi:hypothetical protein
VEEVFTEATISILFEAKHLAIFEGRAGHGKGLKLPSWVTDWTEPQKILRLGPRSDANDFHSYKPCLGLESKIVYIDMKHLALLGMYVDTVSEIYWTDEVFPGCEDDSFIFSEEALLQACETMKLQGEYQLTGDRTIRHFTRL